MENNEQDIAIVKEIANGYVWLEMERIDSCNSCSMNGICNQDGKVITHKIKTDIKVEIGDRLKVEISPKLRVLSSLIIFIFPIVMMIIFYLIGKYILSLNEDFSIITSLVGLLISGFIVYFIDKQYSDKINLDVLEKINSH